MRLLVVGGAGYIGSHAVRALARAGHSVWAYDNLGQGHAGAVPSGSLVVGDLQDTRKLTETLADLKIDAVLHFAAFAQVGESVTDPGKYWHNNVAGSISLLEAMRAAGVCKIVFSSTTAVYGVPRTLPITERESRSPINPYGQTKLVVEDVLADYARAYGFGYAALRYFNASGASPDGEIGEDHAPETHLIPLVLEVALGRRPNITVFGDDYPTRDGTCIRDYVHVDDLISAHAAALDRLAPGVELRLNLGTGRGYSVREVIDACRRAAGHAIPTVIGPRRAGDPPELIADASQARSVLQWAPRYTSIDDIVATAWRWHSTHPQGYADRSGR
jgi:UDP-glucose 4-epimerase